MGDPVWEDFEAAKRSEMTVTLTPAEALLLVSLLPVTEDPVVLSLVDKLYVGLRDKSGAPAHDAHL